MKQQHLFWLAALTAAIAVPSLGCGSDGSAMQGIYEVSTWTENTDSCDAEGASILADASQTTFYIKDENLFGAQFINVKFCDSLADCEAVASEKDTINLGRFGFGQGSDSAGWRAKSFAGFADQAGACSGDFVETALTSAEEGRVRVEIRSTPASGFQAESDGFCDDDKGEAAAAGQPCGSLEVFTANLVADLP